jgi:hypothetical protein
MLDTKARLLRRETVSPAAILFIYFRKFRRLEIPKVV